MELAPVSAIWLRACTRIHSTLSGEAEAAREHRGDGDEALHAQWRKGVGVLLVRDVVEKGV